MPRFGSTFKVLTIGTILCIGGPALVSYVRPSEEELFAKFNPELQKRNLEMREQRQKDFDNFVTQLKVHSKSNKSIWEAAKEAEAKRKQELENVDHLREKENSQIQQEELSKELATGRSKR